MKVRITITQELHDAVQATAEAREVPFAVALDSVIRAGVSRVTALDRHALVKSGHLKPTKTRKKATPRKRAQA